jgi:replicative DNA helicase
MFNAETEKIVLSCLIMSPSSITKIFEVLKTEDFYVDKHRIIFDSIKALNENKIKISAVTLNSYYVDNKIDAQSETVDLLEYWTGGIVDNYINDILDYSARRKLSALIRDTNQLIQNKNYSLEKACYDIDEQIKVIASNKTNTLVSLKDMSTGKIEDVSESKRYYQTGLKDLDYGIHGIFCSELIILAARPKSGKTALAGNIAVNIAKKHPAENVLIMSLEMKRNQLRRRFLSQEAEIDSFILKTGKYETQEQKIKVENAMIVIDDLPVYISDSVYDLEPLVNSIKRFASLKKISVAIVDYIQLVNHWIKGANREQIVSEIGRTLKNLASELNIPILALSQLNRSVELRPDQKPVLSDLRESGALEQHADMVWFIYQDKKLLDKNEIAKNQYHIDVAANRDGKAGFEVDVTFIKEYTKFTNFMEQ